MRYSHIKSQAQYVNSKRNIILRQHFAKKFSDVLQTGCLILNFDETALQSSDNRAKGWVNKHASAGMVYRREYTGLTLLTVISNDGKVFASMLRGSHNVATFCIFLCKLTKKLDETYGQRWRRGVLLLDNATLHKHQMAITLATMLRINLFFTAPASYQLVPIERYFAILKQERFTYGQTTPSR